ncbi:hypothetical protein PFISCL1PPCAC_23821 [Pristionchus fissidentatus]|uniref:Uncharacterized protein n=1 Tax=Pristionchus fissidentatus TaxID=1538716 RepID=A0AAV5WKA0_9BILA|nr:hypothetical protein PFISCL1PPCAC_23821 [Pristionchus fissidentatus]
MRHSIDWGCEFYTQLQINYRYCDEYFKTLAQYNAYANASQSHFPFPFSIFLLHFVSFLHLKIAFYSPVRSEGIAQNPYIHPISFVISDDNCWLISNDLRAIGRVETAFIEEETTIDGHFHDCRYPHGDDKLNVSFSGYLDNFIVVLGMKVISGETWYPSLVFGIYRVTPFLAFGEGQIRLVC